MSNNLLEKQIDHVLIQLAKHFDHWDIYTEKEIRNLFGSEISGIDHLILCDNNIITIQDKWESSTPTIRDINHFIKCSDDIFKRKEYKKKSYHGLFVSKKPCGKDGLKSLTNAGFSNVYTDTSIKDLAELVKIKICDMLDLELSDSDSDTQVVHKKSNSKSSTESSDEYNSEDSDDTLESNEKPNNNVSLNDIFKINIALAGCISAGKTTFANAILCNQFASCKMTRTTIVPCVYSESDDVLEYDNITKIKELIDKTNLENSNKKENLECLETILNVGKLKNFCPLKNGVHYNIYDIPGLNDSKAKKTYKTYLKNKMCNFDIVVYIIDVKNCIQTTDEHKNLEIIMKKISTFKENGYITHLITIINKIDDMTFSPDGNYKIRNQEMKDMFEQCKSDIEELAKSYDILDLCKNIIPMCAEDAFIYRLVQNNVVANIEDKYIDKYIVDQGGKQELIKLNEEIDNCSNDQSISKQEIFNKIINNENKRDICISRLSSSGFSNFERIINDILSDEKLYEMLSLKILNKLTCVKSIFDVNFNSYHGFETLCKIYEQEVKLNTLFNKMGTIRTHTRILDLLPNYKITIENNCDLCLNDSALNISHFIELLDKDLTVINTIKTMTVDNQEISQLLNDLTSIIMTTKVTIIKNNILEIEDDNLFAMITDHLMACYNKDAMPNIMDVIKERYLKYENNITLNLYKVVRYLSDKYDIISSNSIRDIIYEYLKEDKEHTLNQQVWQINKKLHDRYEDLKYVLDGYLRNGSFKNWMDDSQNDELLDKFVAEYVRLFNMNQFKSYTLRPTKLIDITPVKKSNEVIHNDMNNNLKVDEIKEVMNDSLTQSSKFDIVTLVKSHVKTD